MNPWLMLNIDETDDKAAIKRAYMSELPKYNPEDDPEGFQKLRAAYEQALSDADNKASDLSIDDSPIGDFSRKLKALYDDFARRREPSEWAELFSDDICLRLDLEDVITVYVLEFLLGNFFLPVAALKEIDKALSLSDKQDKLKKRYPQDFIDFLLGAGFDLPRYELFDETNAQLVDRAIHLMREANRHFSEGKLDEAQKVFDALCDTGIKNPDFDMCRAKALAARGEHAQAIDIAKPIYEQYPEHYFTCESYAYILAKAGGREMLEEALSIRRALHERHPDAYQPIEGMVDCLHELGEHEQARDILYDAIDRFPSAAYLRWAFKRESAALVEVYKKKHEQNPKDFDTAMNYCKHLLNIDNVEESIKVLKKFSPRRKDARYYSYLSYCHSDSGNFDKAIKYMRKSIELEKTHNKYENLAAMLLCARRYDDCIAVAGEGLGAAIADGKPSFRAAMRQLEGTAYFKQGKHSEALAAFDAGIAEKDDFFGLYVAKAEALIDNGQIAEAMDCCEASIALMPYFFGPYALEMKMYTQAGRPEDALCVYERASEIISDCLPLEQRKAEALLGLGREREAVEILEKTLKSDEADEATKALCNVTYGEIFYAKQDYEKARGYFEAAALSDEADRQAYDSFVDTLIKLGEYKTALKWQQIELDLFDTPGNRLCEAWLCRKLGNGDTAISKLEEAAKIYPESESVNRTLAEYCYSIRGDYEKALEYYTAASQLKDADSDILNDMAFCLGRLERFDEALDILARQIEAEPDNVWVYARRGYIYYDMSRHDEALSDHLRALEDVERLGERYNVDEIYYQIGHLYEEHFADPVSAEKYYKLTLGQNPDFALCYLCLGDINTYHYENYAAALENYNKKVEMEPDIANGYFVRAKLYMRMGERELAAADFKKTIAMYKKRFKENPDDPCAHRHIGECLLGLGRPNKALEHFRRAVAAKANCKQKICDEAIFGMCQYYAQKGNYAKALELLDLAQSHANRSPYAAYRRKLESV